MHRPIVLRLLLPALVACLPAVVVAQNAPATAQIVYTFAHPQLQPARYTITIDENGTGHFVSVPNATVSDDDGVSPAPIDRRIQVDEALRSGLFSWAHAHNFFSAPCDRGRGGLAFTGNRTLTYSGPDGNGSCSYIWAADNTLQHLTEQLDAVAFTLEVGRRLDVEVVHDRLGLDAELQSLQDAVKSQRASGLPNIAPQLRTIASDQQVMDRARKRALALLARCDSPVKAN